MSQLRPQLRGLVSRLALFYVLLSLPTLVIVESAILVYEFHHFLGGLAAGSLDRAAARGANELAAQWPKLRASDSADAAVLDLWLDHWLLRLRQPRGGLTPDESYLLLELSNTPLAAAILAPDGRLLARSREDTSWSLQLPAAATIAQASQLDGMHARALPGSEDPNNRIERTLVPLRDRAGDLIGVLFVELRLPLPWRHLFFDASFESPTVLAFLIVFGIASSIFLAAWVTRRLNRIARAASAWSRGDFSDRIGDRSRDELGRLSSLLDSMANDLKGLLRTRAQLATLAERQRLARDLHDTVKQKAFALNLQLATARRMLAGAPGAERLEPAERLTQQIQHELAQILDEMRMSDAELPFAERVRTRAIEWSHTSNMALDFDLDDTAGFAARSEEAMLRILDEALANVLRHSGATRVRIGLRREAERVCFTIADNGRGMAERASAGMGLGNMRGRSLELPGGHFEIETSPESGTRVSVSFLPAEMPDR